MKLEGLHLLFTGLLVQVVSGQAVYNPSTLAGSVSAALRNDPQVLLKVENFPLSTGELNPSHAAAVGPYKIVTVYGRTKAAYGCRMRLVETPWGKVSAGYYVERKFVRLLSVEVEFTPRPRKHHSRRE